MAKVLLVDDEVTMVQLVAESLRNWGHEVHPFTNGMAALEAIQEIQPEVIVTDLYLDRTKAFGLDLLKHSKKHLPSAVVIVITGFGSIETAVEAMKHGAFDYLEKPFKLDELKLSLERALSYNEAVSENAYLRKQLKKKYQFKQIIGTSAKMQEVFKMIERVSDTESTVLILGESGTGKELVAKALHFNSNRRSNPFIPINCSALPENLLESELFGHRKGAFTGAFQDKKGLFEEADGGTIFLDEIGTMPPTLQSRLLRVLQEKEVRRVGENTPVKVDVRVLAATNETLEDRIKQGEFREDLYYRLNVIPIHLPGLRERPDDIPLLVAHFLKDKVHPRIAKVFQMSRICMNALTRHSWPGNVRELQNLVERACALSESHVIRRQDLPNQIADLVEEDDTEVGTGFIEKADNKQVSDLIFPLASNTPASSPRTSGKGSDMDANVSPLKPLKHFLRDQEVGYLNRVMTHTGGDKEQTAEILEVSLATLYRKLAEQEN
ncbi:MAG: sigma-54 dependent transcriptional regulator [Verrucomicrobiota bacterium]|nr:sigma-54 dependent transcriptional regulator [Verrucomicrobiota bacterium]